MRSSKAYGWNPTRNQTFRSPLYSWGGSVTYASHFGHETIVRLLVEHGADIGLVELSDVKTATEIASEQGHSNIVKFLVENGASYIRIACEKGDIEYVKAYIDSGESVNLIDDNDRTLIMHATKSGHENIVRLLVEKGANIEIEDYHGMTPIMMASEQGHLSIVKFLAENRARINEENEEGWTAVMCASANGFEDIVRCLAKNGADFEAENQVKLTAMIYALYNDNENIVRTLIESGDSLSSLIPKSIGIEKTQYIECVTKLIKIYGEYAVKDSQFGEKAQRHVEEVLNGKTTGNREPLTEEDEKLLRKLLKTLRSIDYTEQNRRKNDTEPSPAYDMEL